MARPKKTDNVETVGASVPQQEVKEIERIAKENRWSKAAFSGDLMLLGLNVYRLTKSLEVPEEVRNAYEAPKPSSRHHSTTLPKPAQRKLDPGMFLGKNGDPLTEKDEEAILRDKELEEEERRTRGEAGNEDSVPNDLEEEKTEEANKYDEKGRSIQCVDDL